MSAKENVLIIYPDAAFVKFRFSMSWDSNWHFNYEINIIPGHFLGGSNESEADAWKEAMININREMMFRLEY